MYPWRQHINGRCALLCRPNRGAMRQRMVAVPILQIIYEDLSHFLFYLSLFCYFLNTTTHSAPTAKYKNSLHSRLKTTLDEGGPDDKPFYNSSCKTRRFQNTFLISALRSRSFHLEMGFNLQRYFENMPKT